MQTRTSFRMSPWSCMTLPWSGSLISTPLVLKVLGLAQPNATPKKETYPAPMLYIQIIQRLAEQAASSALAGSSRSPLGEPCLQPQSLHAASMLRAILAEEPDLGRRTFMLRRLAEATGNGRRR